MVNISLIIDGRKVNAPPGATILSACQKAGIYISTLCFHPYLSPPFELETSDFVYRGKQKLENQATNSKKYSGCGLCLVQIQGGELVKACNTEIQEGMVISTISDVVNQARQENLSVILANHPHACLTCAQNQGCSLEPCTNNVVVNERCCSKFGRCEIQKVADFVGIRKETPKYTFRNLPIIRDEPLFTFDYNLCIGCLRCVQVCQEKRGVGALGFVIQNGEVLLGTIAPTLKESGCKFCGACVEVCPSGTILDKDIKGIPTEKELVPCISACPIEMDVPGYISTITEKNFNLAQKIIKQNTPFPLVLGRVCFHPCEINCRRSFIDDPLAICALKRLAFEFETFEKEEIKSPPTGKKVAIIGSGPAGLSCAYYLANLGHKVTAFESQAEPGGMLRYGIPNFRLPKEIVDNEIKQILKLGIELKTNVVLGKDITLEQLNSNFDAIFLAVGTQASKRINLEGIELEGVLWGLEFLRKVKSGEDIKLKEKVAVIGGGDVAIDVAMTALRLTDREVQVFCLEEKDQMPAHPWQVRQALEEGVILNCGWGPKKIIGDGKNVTGVELVKCISVFDQEGNFKPQFDESQKKFLEVGTIIFAIGQTLDSSIFNGEDLKSIAGGGTIKVNPDTLETNLKGLFSGGDVVSGPRSVVEAIQMGRQAAVSIDKFLGEDGNLDKDLEAETTLISPEQNGWLGKDASFADRNRVPIPTLTAEQRNNSFSELERGYNQEQGLQEAQRCLRCDLRLKIPKVCLPPKKYLEFTLEKINSIVNEEGVFQLLDQNQKIILISGTLHLRQSLLTEFKSRKNACYFIFEENQLYTQRETELLQQFLQRNGKLPQGNEEIDDLY